VKSKICAYSKSKVQDININDAIELVKAVSVEVSFGDDNMVNASNNEELEHYVKTFSRAKEDDGSSRRPKVYSVDCEMVSTSAGMELARVSVIEFVGGAAEGGDDAEEKSIAVLDELVNPRRCVLDYLTQFSGITPKMLLNVNIRIEVIQLFLLSVIHEEDIIVAHSGENDLKALRLVHNNIVDTSVIFRGDNGRKYSLKHLSNVLLQKQIQSSSAGHCSKEDAEAALILALRRARLGTSFRLKEAAKPINVIEVFQKVGKIGVDGNSGSGDETSFAERNDRSCVCIGPNEWLRGQSSASSQHLLCCESLNSSMSMAVPSWLASKKSSRAGLLWAKLVCGSDGLQQEIKKQDEIIDSLVTSVPHDTVFLVVFQRNLNAAIALSRQRKAATNQKATCAWSDAQEEEWKRYMTCTRNCEALWIGNI
jgi:DNA polymerase III epsilon subunit-like protein